MAQHNKARTELTNLMVFGLSATEYIMTEMSYEYMRVSVISDFIPEDKKFTSNLSAPKTAIASQNCVKKLSPECTK